MSNLSNFLTTRRHKSWKDASNLRRGVIPLNSVSVLLRYIFLFKSGKNGIKLYNCVIPCCWLYRSAPLDTLGPDLKLPPLAQHKELSPATPYRHISWHKSRTMCRATMIVLKASELLTSVIKPLFFMFVKQVFPRIRQQSVCHIVNQV